MKTALKAQFKQVAAAHKVALHRYHVTILPKLTPIAVDAVLAQFKRAAGKQLLVTDYVSPEMARRLQQAKVQFMDAVGNLYINDAPRYIFVTGNAAPARKKKEVAGRAFYAGGLRIIFVLLCKPELLNATYREIAHAAGVALGTVADVMKDLARQRYILKTKAGLVLIHKKALMGRWVEAYSDRLRPKMVLGRYRAENKVWWQGAVLDPRETQWGGEVAAARKIGDLKPAQAVLYTRAHAEKLAIQNQLTMQTDGDVEVLKMFWDFHAATDDCVPPLLIYADLVVSGDGRGHIAAGKIYDHDLARLVGED